MLQDGVFQVLRLRDFGKTVATLAKIAAFELAHKKGYHLRVACRVSFDYFIYTTFFIAFVSVRFIVDLTPTASLTCCSTET